MNYQEKYLQEHNYKLQLDKLAKKFKNKKILIYGYGSLFKTIELKYDLKQFNIIGVVDKKFSKFNNNDFPRNYSLVKYEDLFGCEFDAILIATENYLPIIKDLKKKTNKEVAPLIKKSCLELLKESCQKFLNPKKNTFVLIKTNGKKIFNPKIKNLKLKLYGKNNYIEIHEAITIKNEFYVSCENNNKIIIGSNNIYDRCRLFLGSNNEISIGKNTTIENADFITRHSSNKSIKLGDDCMISYNVKFRTTDGHTIYDSVTKEILNKSQNINIREHVWICANTTILKGVEIPSNCIVGTGAIVSQKFSQENCIIAGVPAQVVKENINWSREATN